MIHLRAIVTMLLTIVTLVSIVLTTEIKWTKYEFEDVSKGFSCATTEYLFKRDDVADSFACSTSCFLQNNCITAEFNLKTLQCFGCSIFSFQTLSSSESVIMLSRRDYNIDCNDVLEKDEHAKSGVYEIRLYNLEPTDVYCDMETDGGGCTIFQRRFNGSVDFNRSYSDYESGFVHASVELLLGTELTIAHSEMTARIAFNPAFAKSHEYFNFTLVGRSYKIFAEPTGSSYSWNLLFTGSFVTYDRDSVKGCAQSPGGGWWFNDNCMANNPTRVPWYLYDNDFGHANTIMRVRRP